MDFLYISQWWFLLFAIGVISIPLTTLVFRKFTDLGYGFAKVAGILITSYLIFVAAVVKILPFTNLAIFLVLGLYLFLNLYIFSKFRDVIIKLIRKSWKVMIFQELFFTSGYLFWAFVRGHQPAINGLEKFMDFGFINSLLRSEFLPPLDMWFAGKTINYYWYGHFITAFVTKISQIPSGITYNLMLATILGFGLTSAFSISSTLVKSLRQNLNRRIAYLAGIISAILLIFAGNFHTPIYALKQGRDKYWYPDATRFIGYNPDTNDKTIHEFPLYSFVVADLHAHLINFPFVLLYIALLLNLSLFVKWKSLGFARDGELVESFKIGNSKNKIIVFLGLVLGVMFMTSAWDFANYSLVTGITIFFFCLKRRGLKPLSFIEAGVTTTSIVFLGLLTTLPFLRNFDSIAQGAALVKAHTPIWQLAVLWGFIGLLTIILSLVIYKIRPKLKKADVFAAALLVSSLALIILPEIIYVKDIYIASHHRANTMFKLTYQAFVMSYLASGYVAIRSLIITKRLWHKLALIGFYGILFASLLWYPSFAIKSYYGDLQKYKSLSGETWLNDIRPDLYSLIIWMRANIKGQPVILEAPGASYTEYNVVSAYTGLPTVSGWFVHEWLWRGTSEIPQERVTDITQIYTSQDINHTRLLLTKYKVEYVIVGEFEREKFPDLFEQKFSTLGTLVFSSGNTKLYKLN